MSICVDKKRKKYYISYKAKLPDGTFKTFNIRNAEWNVSRGKKFIQAIEQEEIEKDINKRKLLYHSGSNINLTELTNYFMNEVNSISKRQTAYNKKLIINKYILPNFTTTTDLDKTFSIQTIERFKKQIISLEKLSAGRKNRILKLLKSLLEYASDHEYLSYELFRKLKVLIKPIRESKKSSQEKIVFWTNEEWDKFYETFQENDIWRVLFKTTYVCALRIGELIALKWSDFNPITKRINISKSMDCSGYLDDAKTDSSQDTVSLSEDLTNDLLKLKEDMYATDNDYMFFANGHTSRTTIRRKMSEHIQAAGITYIKFHGLRHSCASRMINAGVSPLIVSKHLRHSSVKETLDTYSHIFPSETMGIIDKVFK